MEVEVAPGPPALLHYFQKRCEDACESPVKSHVSLCGNVNFSRDVGITLSADFSSKEEAESEETKALFERCAVNVIDALP